MLKLTGLVVAAALFEGAAARPAVPVVQPGAIPPPEDQVQLYPPPSDGLFGSLFEPPALPGPGLQEKGLERGGLEGNRSVRPALPPTVTTTEKQNLVQEEAPDAEPCGIRIIPADPSVDPRMPRAFSNPAVQHTIRVVPVPPCEPS